MPIQEGVGGQVAGCMQCRKMGREVSKPFVTSDESTMTRKPRLVMTCMVLLERVKKKGRVKSSFYAGCTLQYGARARAGFLLFHF